MEPAGPTRVERRLAAIFAADVAGYSRLIEANEQGTLGRLKALRAEVIDPRIAEHHGRIVKTTGDGMLVEFASVVDAVRCAAEVQAAMAKSNAPLPHDRRIEFRIGIHQGDIVAEDGDIFGDGVNVAARLEGLAEPGGICVSARVQEDAAGRLDLAFEDLGEQELKNIARKVRVYRVRPTLTHPAASAPGSPLSRNAGEGAERQRREAGEGSPALPLPDKPSIAVLPFANLSGDPEQEYFADGTLEEIFVLQDRVAVSVAGIIEPALQAAEMRRSAARPTTDLSAYDLYLRALAAIFPITKDRIYEALGLLEQAIAIDPRYGPALSWAAMCY